MDDHKKIFLAEGRITRKKRDVYPTFEEFKVKVGFANLYLNQMRLWKRQ
jgi:hypothetical protein